MSTPRPLPPPPADWEPGPRGAAPTLPQPAAAPEPDIPFGPPLAPGELAELVVDSGHVREQDLPAAERAALQARRQARGVAGESPEQAARPTRERAKAMLDAALPTLATVAADTNASDSDRISAIRELAKLADVYEQAAAHVSYVVVMPAQMQVEQWEQAQAARVVDVQPPAARAVAHTADAGAADTAGTTGRDP